MTSQRKILSNRKNAQKSTGPRTNSGRSRSSQNARRHGFESAGFKDDRYFERANQLVEAICKGEDDPTVWPIALVIAECQLTLWRVRQARVKALAVIRAYVLGTQKPERQIAHVAERADDTKPASEELHVPSVAEEEERVIRAAAVSSITWYRELGDNIDHLIEADIKRAITIVDRTGRIVPPMTKLIALQGDASAVSQRAKLCDQLSQLTQRLNELSSAPVSAPSPVQRAWAQLASLERYERRALSKRRKAIRRLAELRAE